RALGRHAAPVHGRRGGPVSRPEGFGRWESRGAPHSPRALRYGRVVRRPDRREGGDHNDRELHEQLAELRHPTWFPDIGRAGARPRWRLELASAAEDDGRYPLAGGKMRVGRLIRIDAEAFDAWIRAGGAAIPAARH